MIALEGEIQTRTYQDKDGNNRKVTEIVVSQASFTGEKKEGGNNTASTPAGTPPIPTQQLDGFETAGLSDDGVPF
jgi:single-strand DNA-binding protein